MAQSTRVALGHVSIALARNAEAFRRDRSWKTFGYARLEDHARERFGRSAVWLRDLAALGRGVDRFSVLAPAITGEDGGPPLGQVAARLLSGAADSESVAEWIRLARRLPVREFKAIVRQARALGSTRPPAGRQATVQAAGGDSSATTESDPDDTSLVRLEVPSAVRAAFEEVVALHRAVSGHEVPVTSLVDALVAEALAGPSPPDVERLPIGHVARRRVIERALASSTGLWSHLQRDAGPAREVAQATRALERLTAITRQADVGTPRQLDERIRRLVELEDELQRCLGGLLETMGNRGDWKRLRFAGVGHYAAERLGLSRRSGEDRACVSRALRLHPTLRAAYESGEVSFCSVRLILRILGRQAVDSEAEQRWLGHTSETSTKRLREEARALGRERATGRCAQPPAPLRDDEWIESLLLRPGTTRDRVGELGRRAADEPLADVLLRLRMSDDLAARFVAAIESARRNLEAQVARVPWDQNWSDASAAASVIAARLFFVRCRRTPAWIGLLVLLEDYVDTWDNPEGMPKRRADAVYVRDGWRCSAPGCTSRSNLEDHHIEFRSHGGECLALWNRLTLCRFHHQVGVHGGLATCAGEAPLNVVWRLGREDVATWYRNERRLPRAPDRTAAAA